MSSTKQNSFFKIISIILIISFIVMDISWANPDIGKARTSTLALPSMFKGMLQSPAFHGIQLSPMEKSELLYSLQNISEYFFDVPANVAKERELYVAGVMRRKLKAQGVDIAPGIGLDRIRFEKEVIYIPYQRKGIDYVITINGNNKVGVHRKKESASGSDKILTSLVEKYDQQITELAKTAFKGDKGVAMKAVLQWQKEYNAAIAQGRLDPAKYSEEGISIERLLRIKTEEGQKDATEYFRLINEDGTYTGEIRPRELCHLAKEGEYIHRGIFVVILDKKGRVLLQQRSMTKTHFPNALDISVGGHMGLDDDPETDLSKTLRTSALREMEEEVFNNEGDPYDETYKPDASRMIPITVEDGLPLMRAYTKPPLGWDNEYETIYVYVATDEDVDRIEQVNAEKRTNETLTAEVGRLLWKDLDALEREYTDLVDQSQADQSETDNVYAAGLQLIMHDYLSDGSVMNNALSFLKEEMHKNLTYLAEKFFKGDKDAAMKAILGWQKEYNQAIAEGLLDSRKYPEQGVTIERLLTIKTEEVQKNATEYFWLIDEEGSYTGEIRPRDLCHLGEQGEYLHRSVFVLVFDENGNMLMQQRSSKKAHFPSTKDVSVAGHTALSEGPDKDLEASLKEAALKEIEEEILNNEEGKYNLEGFSADKNKLVLLGEIDRLRLNYSFDEAPIGWDNERSTVYMYVVNEQERQRIEEVLFAITRERDETGVVEGEVSYMYWTNAADQIRKYHDTQDVTAEYAGGIRKIFEDKNGPVKEALDIIAKHTNPKKPKDKGTTLNSINPFAVGILAWAGWQLIKNNFELIILTLTASMGVYYFMRAVMPLLSEKYYDLENEVRKVGKKEKTWLVSGSLVVGFLIGLTCLHVVVPVLLFVPNLSGIFIALAFWCHEFFVNKKKIEDPLKRAFFRWFIFTGTFFLSAMYFSLAIFAKDIFLSNLFSAMVFVAVGSSFFLAAIAISFSKAELENAVEQEVKLNAIFQEKRSRKKILQLVTKKEPLTKGEIESLVKFAGRYCYGFFMGKENPIMTEEAATLFARIGIKMKTEAGGNILDFLAEVSLASDDHQVWEAVDIFLQEMGIVTDLFERSSERSLRRRLINDLNKRQYSSVELNSIEPFTAGALGLLALSGIREIMSVINPELLMFLAAGIMLFAGLFAFIINSGKRAKRDLKAMEIYSLLLKAYQKDSNVDLFELLEQSMSKQMKQLKYAVDQGTNRGLTTYERKIYDLIYLGPLSSSELSIDLDSRKKGRKLYSVDPFLTGFIVWAGWDVLKDNIAILGLVLLAGLSAVIFRYIFKKIEKQPSYKTEKKTILFESSVVISLILLLVFGGKSFGIFTSLGLGISGLGTLLLYDISKNISKIRKGSTTRTFSYNNIHPYLLLGIVFVLGMLSTYIIFKGAIVAPFSTALGLFVISMVNALHIRKVAREAKVTGEHLKKNVFVSFAMIVMGALYLSLFFKSNVSVPNIVFLVALSMAIMATAVSFTTFFTAVFELYNRKKYPVDYAISAYVQQQDAIDVIKKNRDKITDKDITMMIKFLGIYALSFSYSARTGYRLEHLKQYNRIMRLLNVITHGNFQTVLIYVSENSDDPEIWRSVHNIFTKEGVDYPVLQISEIKSKTRQATRERNKLLMRGDKNINLNSIDPFSIGLLAWLGWEVIKNTIGMIIGLGLLAMAIYAIYKVYKKSTFGLLRALASEDLYTRKEAAWQLSFKQWKPRSPEEHVLSVFAQAIRNNQKIKVEDFKRLIVLMKGKCDINEVSWEHVDAITLLSNIQKVIDKGMDFSLKITNTRHTPSSDEILEKIKELYHKSIELNSSTSHLKAEQNAENIKIIKIENKEKEIDITYSCDVVNTNSGVGEVSSSSIFGGARRKEKAVKKANIKMEKRLTGQEININEDVKERKPVLSRPEKSMPKESEKASSIKVKDSKGSRSSGKRKKQAKKTVQMFELVEGYLNNRRAETVKALNEAKHLLRGQKNANEFPSDLAKLNVEDTTENLILAVKEILEAIDKKEKRYGLSREMLQIRKTILKYKDDLYTDAIIVSIIVKAMKAQKEGEMLIIALETGWIPGNEKGKWQDKAIGSLLEEIRSLKDTLRHLGLDNVLFVEEGKETIISEVLNKMRETSSGFDNVVLLADKDITETDDFSVMREGSAGEKPFVGLINAEELNSKYEQFGEDRKHQIYAGIIEMFTVLLEASVGKDVSSSMIVDNNFKEGDGHIIMFLPPVEIMSYESLKQKYLGHLKTMQAA